MASLNFGLTIKNYKAKSIDLENLMSDLYEDKILKHKHSSNDKEDILLEFKTQQEPLRNKIDTSRDGQDNEQYKAQMAELQELQDAKDDALKSIENEAQAYEEEYDMQIASLKSQKEAVDADIQSMESARDEGIKKDYTYGQKS